MPMSSSSPARTSSSAAGNHRQQSRLQRRAPPLKITPTPAIARGWNAAIPLLSPLAASPTSALDQIPVTSPSEKSPGTEESAAEKTLVFKKWQHPAAPFYYETTPFAPPFVPV